VQAAKAISLPASREIIHVLPRQFIVDGESGVKDPVGMSGVRLEVDTHLVTASTAALKNLRKTASEVGVTANEVVFSGVAASYSTLTDTEKELGCVLIDIGAGITSVAVYVDGALAYSGAIPVGARNVTNDLAIGLRVSLDTAEKIKLDLGDLLKKEKDLSKLESISITDEEGKEEKKLSVRTITDGIIRPRLSEIFSIVRLDLEKAGLINRIPSGAVITGGGAHTVGILDVAKKSLYLPVRLGMPQGVGGLVDDILTPSYSTAIGLILYGVNESNEEQIQPKASLSSISKKVKLPSGNFFDKIMETVRNLLP
jgi:cell division protein FtsA